MAGGLAALLDDVAVIAKAASAASGKAAGVVVDDTAVTPQYVRGFSPARELPIIAKIARGSLGNKAILITLLLLLDHFLPVVLTPLLMLGGLYLSFEGAEKVYEALTGGGHGEHEADDPAVERGADYEKQMVRSAVLTDFILSAEIMVISLNTLNENASQGLGLWEKAIALVITGILITIGVYGVVALIVKMDDVGLAMSRRENAGTRRFGQMLVDGMPKVLTLLSTVGMIAMLWVGGHILLVGLDELGWHTPYGIAHHLGSLVHGVAGVGAFLAWLVETLCSAVFALVVGGVLVLVAHLLPFHGKGKHDDFEDAPALDTHRVADTGKGETGLATTAAAEPLDEKE